jgi:hypothetical protein
VQISLLVEHFSVWVFSSTCIQFAVVYSTFHFQLAAVYSFGFQLLQDKQVAVFDVGINPMDKALGLRSFPLHREDDIPSWSRC